MLVPPRLVSWWGANASVFGTRGIPFRVLSRPCRAEFSSTEKQQHLLHIASRRGAAGVRFWQLFPVRRKVHHSCFLSTVLNFIAPCLQLLFLSGNVKKWPRKAVLCFAAEHVALGFLLTNGASPGLGEEEGKLKCSCQGKSHNSHVCIISASPNMNSRWEEQPPHPRELRCLYNTCRACFWSALSADVQILVFERLYRTEHVWIPMWCWWHGYNYVKSSVGAKANKAISSNHKNART